MIFDLSSFIPGLSFILYVIFTVFSLNKKKDEKLHWPFILYMFLMSVWSFGSFMMHANTKVLTPLNWNRIMVAGVRGEQSEVFGVRLHGYNTGTRKQSPCKSREVADVGADVQYYIGREVQGAQMVAVGGYYFSKQARVDVLAGVFVCRHGFPPVQSKVLGSKSSM